MAGILLTLGFFLSGFFVLLTPLPLVYQILCRKKKAIVQVILPCFAVLAVIYWVGLNPLFHFYRAHPDFAWLFPLPAINLLPDFGTGGVTAIGLTQFSFFVLAAFLIAAVFRSPRRLARFLGGGTFLFCAFVGGVFLLYSVLTHQSLLGLLHDYYQGALQDYVSLNEKTGLPPEKLAYLKDNLSTLVHYLALFSPSLLFVTVLSILVVNLIAAQKFLSFALPSLREFSLSYWEIGFQWVWVVISLLALWLFNSLVWHQTFLLAVSVNGLIALFFIYFLKGLGLIVFWMDQKRVGPFVRFGTYLLIFLLFQTLGVLIAGFGFFDSWFDVKKKLGKGIKGG